MDQNCTIDGCDSKVFARGWCCAHYKRWRAHGDPTAGETMRRPQGLSDEEVFAWFMKGDPPPAPSPTEGCWDWPGSLVGGYGRWSSAGRTVRAHVISHRIYNGPVGSDDHVLHSCDRKVCVQPAHLRVGTHAENMAESAERGRNAVGVRHARAQLTDADVRWIRENPDGLSQTERAARLGVTQSVVSRVVRRKAWKHLP